jgi:type III secretion protein R
MKQESVFESIFFSSNGVSLSHIILLFSVGLIPIVLMSMTSYLKVSIVLSILRNALGGGQIPSQALSGILALVITFFTMAPVLESCLLEFSNQEEVVKNASKSPTSKKTISLETTIKHFQSGLSPLLEFIKLNTSLEERLFFLRMDKKRVFLKQNKNLESQSKHFSPFEEKDFHSECENILPEEVVSCLEKHERVSSLVISFIISELRIAFTIGIYLFLPFPVNSVGVLDETPLSSTTK